MVQHRIVVWKSLHDKSDLETQRSDIFRDLCAAFFLAWFSASLNSAKSKKDVLYIWLIG